MSMVNFRQAASEGVITFASGFHDKLQWAIGSFQKGFSSGGRYAGGTLGSGASWMRYTIGDGVGRDTAVCIAGFACILRGGAGVRWGWCATLGGACLGSGVGS